MSGPDAGSSSPHLDDGEQKQAAQHASPRALVIHEVVREEGEAAMERTAGALIMSALAAGLSMGFSFLTQAVIESSLPDTPWRSLVASFGYTVGFVIVILGRQQLFTESTLSAVLPVLTRRDMTTVAKTGRLWGLVLFGNIAGTLMFAAMLQIPGVFTDDVVKALGIFGQTTFFRHLHGDGRSRSVCRLADRVDGLAAAECPFGPAGDDFTDHLCGRDEQAVACDRRFS
jgi:hypothetical protein